MIIGVPSEVKDDEWRVALNSGRRARAHLGRAHGLRREGCGRRLVHARRRFRRTGAKIVDSPEDVWAAADLVCKVKEPIAQEYPLLGARKDQTLFTYLHLAASRECTDALVAAGNVAIAYETVRQEDNRSRSWRR